MTTRRQRGNIVIGLIVGLVLGLGVALGIAVYVTKVPIPFMTKTQRGGPEQDEAEARKNRDWNPNAPLAGKPSPVRPPEPPAAPVAPQPSAAAPGVPQTAPAPVVVPPTAQQQQQQQRAARPPVPAEANASPPSSDPIGDLARARSGAGPGTTTAAATPSASDPFMYFVQAGAFRTPEDAETQRARLSLMGVEARVTEREQAGRTVYRVRAGPFNKKEDADRLKERLDGGGLESALVRVQR
ncbi:SPOR domain-containing protein [Variovorax guangxiensis]|uniref:SPOR domain-containing protein n=1 Tax=Variovorax guangxiensis TaxID=1775474 RepID=UPI0028655ABC|nr:SPOR domain-containing protein [Variovorax guangxiensis]MDR6853789.1 cell division protein FtsN [Variovorax guangxiensis]